MGYDVFELSEEAANNFRSQNVGSMKPLLAKNWVQTIWFKLGQEELRYSWYGQMLPVQMLSGQLFSDGCDNVTM